MVRQACYVCTPTHSLRSIQEMNLRKCSSNIIIQHLIYYQDLFEMNLRKFKCVHLINPKVHSTSITMKWISNILILSRILQSSIIIQCLHNPFTNMYVCSWVCTAHRVSAMHIYEMILKCILSKLILFWSEWIVIWNTSISTSYLKVICRMNYSQ